MLVIGMAIGFILIIRDVTAVYSLGCLTEEAMCLFEILDLAFLVPCTFLLISMTGYYDDRTQSRLKEVEEKKGELTKAYTDIIATMDGMLGRAADSSAGLAEKNFAAHRRDFIHFLERVHKRYNESFTGCKIDEMKFIEEFRRLLRHWLHAFQEASIDPEGHPLMIERFPNEFDLYTSLQTLVMEVCDRLKATELKMVSARQGEDQEAINGFKENAAVMDGSSALAIPSNMSSASGQGDLERSLRDLNEMGNAHAERVGCNWCSCCRRNTPCGLQRTPGEVFPMKLGCKCFAMEILCREHLYMITGIVFGLALAGSNAIQPMTSKETPTSQAVLQAAPLLIYSACLMVLCVNIESICELLRLEREVKHIMQERTKVEQVQGEMRAFWDNVQELTDLWLFRTIPRLDLFKELNHHLQDAEPGAMVFQLKAVNERMNQLETNIGALSEWRLLNQQSAKAAASQGSGQAQRQIGDGVARVIRSSQTGTMEQLMHNLDEELGGSGLLSEHSHLKALTAGVPGQTGSRTSIGTAEMQKSGSVEMSDQPGAKAVRY